MASRVLVSGLPQSLPPLPSGPGPSCVPCVEGRLRATPHSSHFPPTEAPLQTLHMDVWGPAPVRGQGHERYFLLVVDDYSRLHHSPPLRSKGAVTEGGSFTTPPSRRVLSSQDVTFDESVPFYRLFPYRTPSLPPPPDFLVPVPPPVDPLPPQVPAPSGVSQVDAADPVEVTGDSGAAAGAEPGVLTLGVLCAGVLSPGGATAGGAEPEGATAEGAEPGGAEPGGGCAWRSCASGSLAAGGVLLSLEVLLELELELLRPSRVRVLPVPELLDLLVLLELELLRALVLSLLLLVLPLEVWVALVLSAEGAGAVPAESGAAARPRPYFVSAPAAGLAERREPASRPASPVRAARASGRSSRQRPPPVPGTHRMSLRPSTAPLRAPLPSPPESSLPALADPESDSLRAASPTVTRLLATVVTDPSFESTAASALVAELVDFAARCRLDYAACLVTESASVCPPSVGGECALGTDVLEDRQEELQCLAAASPHLASVLLAPEGDPDALDIPTPRTYVDAVPPPGANIVSGMWIFRVKRPSGSPPVFKARYVARGFSQRQGVDYFQTFSPTPKMTTLRVLLHIAAQRDYELHSLDFSTAFLQGSLHEEIWLRRPPSFTGTFPPGTQSFAGLTYLLTDLGEPPRSPRVLYVDNKAMLALCREQRLEHRTKHIALRYFLARELQQRGQLRLAYVASEANTADVFTKALAPCDHSALLHPAGSCACLASLALLLTSLVL
ncbi:unnamed protein product [Closterium sp. NIES-64]|nr:unnamed protein product [Closterium sp. NIES-64]